MDCMRDCIGPENRPGVLRCTGYGLAACPDVCWLNTQDAAIRGQISGRSYTQGCPRHSMANNIGVVKQQVRPVARSGCNSRARVLTKEVLLDRPLPGGDGFTDRALHHQSSSACLLASRDIGPRYIVEGECCHSRIGQLPSGTRVTISSQQRAAMPTQSPMESPARPAGLECEGRKLPA